MRNTAKWGDGGGVMVSESAEFVLRSSIFIGGDKLVVDLASLDQTLEFQV